MNGSENKLERTKLYNVFSTPGDFIFVNKRMNTKFEKN